MQTLIEIWFSWVHDWGYLGVILLMAMESSIFPVPSELVIPPAALLAAHQGSMSLTGVILAGTFGSWLGAAITYWVCFLIGRPFVIRFGKYFLMTPQKVEMAESFMHRYESGGIFFARLLPVIRHLISIPAGIIRMNFLKFSILTLIGSAIWCSILAYMGHKVGAKLDPSQIQALKVGKGVDLSALITSVKHESIWIIAVIVILGILHFLMTKHLKSSPPPSAD